MVRNLCSTAQRVFIELCGAYLVATILRCITTPALCFKLGVHTIHRTPLHYTCTPLQLCCNCVYTVWLTWYVFGVVCVRAGAVWCVYLPVHTHRCTLRIRFYNAVF